VFRGVACPHVRHAIVWVRFRRVVLVNRGAVVVLTVVVVCVDVDV
jgi:hypothetical protein